jgi:hypothetical protein
VSADDPSPPTVHILAGHNKSREPVLESVPAERIGDGRFRLLGSPGLAGGAAAGDEIELADDGSFRVVARGGNLSVQVFSAAFDEPSVAELAARAEELGGRLDGGHDQLRVFTVPVSAGFPAIEAAFNDFASKHPATEWYFGNVYDLADGVTPLGWWDSEGSA